MRLMTRNVLAPRYADGASRRAVLAREIQRRAPDVLALQEVTHEDVAALADDGWHVASSLVLRRRGGGTGPPVAPSGTP